MALCRDTLETPFAELDARMAVELCEAALSTQPTSPIVKTALGRALYKTADYDRAILMFRDAADRGSPIAQTDLGVMYFNGNGVSKDAAQAASLYRQAAEQGYAQAQMNLGLAYQSGQGVDRDLRQAASLYRQAAEQGNVGAQTNLGLMYQYGDGIEKDANQAVAWYRRSAEQGDARAQLHLGVLLAKGQGAEKDEVQAVALFRQAAEQGSEQARYNLGAMYETGRGVEQDSEVAVSWYRKAAEQGYAPAQTNLGMRYEIGRGVDKDPKQAIAWYQKAAEQGDAQADLYLGELYLNGIDIPEDEERAKFHLSRAARNGNEDAKAKLEEIDMPANRIIAALGDLPDRADRILRSLLTGDPGQIDPGDMSFLGGVAGGIVKTCRVFDDISKLAALQGFAQQTALNSALGNNYSADLNKIFGNQATAMTLFATGEKIGENVPCREGVADEIAEAILAVADGPSKAQDSLFVSTCSSGQLSHEQCACLARTAMSIMPDIHSKRYSRSVVHDVLERNPFTGFQIMVACGIVNY